MEIINSKKTTFENYKFNTIKYDEEKDKSVANNYAKFLRQPIKEDAVFILNYSKNEDHTAIENIARGLKGKIIYCGLSNQNNLEDCKKVIPVKKHTKLFFEMLATAKYIITDSSINGYYVPRQGQCLITLVDLMKADTFAMRADWTKTLLKSTIITSTVELTQVFKGLCVTDCQEKIVAYDQVVSIIESGRTDFSRADEEGRKTTVIAFMANNIEYWVPHLLNRLSKIDADSEDVILIIEKKQLNKMAEYLKVIDKNVHVVLRQGWFLITEEKRKILDYISAELAYFEDVDDAFKMIDKKIFEREFIRTIGTAKINTFIIMGDDSRTSKKNYWLNIARAIEVEKREIYYDENLFVPSANALELKDVVEKSMTEIFCEFQVIRFCDITQQTEFENFVKKYAIKMDATELEISTLKELTKVSINTQMLSFDGKQYVVYNNYIEKRKQLDVVLKPSEDTINVAYLITSEVDIEEDRLSKIKQYISSNENTTLYIFDFTNHLGNKVKEIVDKNTNIILYTGALYYYVLQPFMNKEFDDMV